MKKIMNVIIAIFLLISISCSAQMDELKIDYEKYTLSNGLDVILHVDRSDPITSFCVKYHVGSNRETPGHTGFAHLFEHMMFQKSENIGEDQFFKLVQSAGGTLNGGTSHDATTYFEIVPKNALEMVLWMESDRMGYMINMVTQKAFAIQQNVVQNEKRQSVDNTPYGHAVWIKAKYLYPTGHPYNWSVIGEMEDLRNATVEDVKEFHAKFYVPNNATIVIAGDIDVAETKAMVEKYFGEIPSGNKVNDLKPQPVKLTEIKKVYHEDNFAKASQLRLIWPTIEKYTPDSYALLYLSHLLSQGKEAPLFKVLEKEKKLCSRPRVSNSSLEIAGTLTVSVVANKGVSLSDVENSVFDAFKRFEDEGFTEEDVERIKARLEIRFFNSIRSILGKSNQLATYNEYAKDPSFYKNDIEMLKVVSKDDILRVYNKYIKDRPYLAMSFVPKGKIDLIAEGSIKAGVIEEDILNATQVEITSDAEEKVVKTKTVIDRSIKPAFGPNPALNLPIVWQDKLSNNLRVFGIEQDELPLVHFNIVLKGGHYLDKPEKAGTASLLARLMTEGTRNKTPLELEEAIKNLGASIMVSANDYGITISAYTLARNYEAVLALVEEILLEPRWDTEEFILKKTTIQNKLIRLNANSNFLSSNVFNKLVYGKDHIFSTYYLGTVETVSDITIDDLKEYYKRNISPNVAFFSIAGQINKAKVISSLTKLAKNWNAKEVKFPKYTLPEPLTESKLYFVDVPGSKQSVISIGNIALTQNNPDYFLATIMNYKFGVCFNSIINTVLREEKGFTYGARSNFSGNPFSGVFMIGSSVRSSATFESVDIFKNLMRNYSNVVTEDDLKFTKDAEIKSNARRFETLGALNQMLGNMGTYDLAADYIRNEEEAVKNLTLEQLKGLANKYINPNKMYYVIVGDAKTQLKELEKVGFGKPILLK